MGYATFDRIGDDCCGDERKRRWMALVDDGGRRLVQGWHMTSHGNNHKVRVAEKGR